MSSVNCTPAKNPKCAAALQRQNSRHALIRKSLADIWFTLSSPSSFSTCWNRLIRSSRSSGEIPEYLWRWYSSDECEPVFRDCDRFRQRFLVALNQFLNRSRIGRLGILDRSSAIFSKTSTIRSQARGPLRAAK